MKRPSFVLAATGFLAGLGFVAISAVAQTTSLFTAPERGAVQERLPTVPPTPPEKAVQSFRVLDGFRMELLAAEPLVASPVSITYDENGRAYVCEMRDYPYTDKARHKPNQENPTDEAIGRIRLLEDLDGDGVFDRATIFAEGLSWPTGAACWKGGIFVAATPDLWYFKDEDGDGRADRRVRVLTGFRKLNVQAVMNNLVWGLDNRIHGAGGSNGGRIVRPEGGDDRPLVMTRADFALDPRDHHFELQSGGARFGGSFDDWGHRFLCNIRNPAQQILLPSRYLARNPWLPARSVLHDMAESGDQLRVHSISPPEPWRVLRAKRWAGERDIVMPRSELVGAGVVTSASGITSYRGRAYPEAYHDNVFVAECAGNLFYRLRLVPDGVTYRAERVDLEAEMVASRDNWFRPVNFCNAPDGTLHVVDMYRENIEHPWSIPEDIHAAVDLEAGRDMGRIWRLAPPGFRPPAPPRLGEAGTAELVAALEHPQAWWRETAQRLLFERQDASAVPALRALVKDGASPQARLHALWTLHGLGALTKTEILSGLLDEAPGVRENALRLAEAWIDDSAVLETVGALAEDPAAPVRFQAVFSLGESRAVEAFAALRKIALQDADDPWIRTALLSSLGETSGRLLAELLPLSSLESISGAHDLVRELAQMVGARGKDEELDATFASLRGQALSESLVHELVVGIGEGLLRARRSLRRQPLSGVAAAERDALLDSAATLALDASRDLEVRRRAVERLAFDDYDRVREALQRLLQGSEAQELQKAAVRSLARFDEEEVASLLLANWATQTPAVRAEVIAAMLGNHARALPLLRAIEAGQVPAHQVPFAQRRLLLNHRDEMARQLASRFFAEPGASPRHEVIERYRPALERRGDPAKGRQVFERACVACHRAGEIGNSEIGPNLANIRAWSPEQILINTLDPNREVASNFLAYQVETVDGRSLYGMIAEETDAGLLLVRPEGGAESLLRRDIASLTGSGVSLMPEGLEAVVSPEDMADLIAFLSAE